MTPNRDTEIAGRNGPTPKFGGFWSAAGWPDPCGSHRAKIIDPWENRGENISPTGIEKNDTGHEDVIRQINQLVAAVLAGEGVADTLSRCAVVFDHIEEQFAMVDSTLQSVHSKYLRVVRLEHERMLGQMNALKREFMANPEAYRMSEKVGRLRSMYFHHLANFDAIVFGGAEEGKAT